MWWTEESEDVAICIYNFQENNTQALIILKRLKFPSDDWADRKYFYRSKSTLD